MVRLVDSRSIRRVQLGHAGDRPDEADHLASDCGRNHDLRQPCLQAITSLYNVGAENSLRCNPTHDASSSQARSVASSASSNESSGAAPPSSLSSATSSTKDTSVAAGVPPDGQLDFMGRKMAVASTQARDLADMVAKVRDATNLECPCVGTFRREQHNSQQGVPWLVYEGGISICHHRIRILSITRDHHGINIWPAD